MKNGLLNVLLFVAMCLFCSCSNKIVDAGDGTGAKAKRVEKVMVEDIASLSFVMKEHGAVMDDCVMVFDGENGTLTVNGSAYTFKVFKWNPKVQKVVFKAYAMGSAVNIGTIEGYFTCYQPDKIYFDGMVSKMKVYNSDKLVLSGTYAIK